VSALLFDTLRLSRTLRDKGHFTPEQAEALAEALGEAGHDGLATNADLAALKAELKADIAEVKAELKADIAEVKADILKWVVGAIGFQTVVILGALVSLARIFAKLVKRGVSPGILRGRRSIGTPAGSKGPPPPSGTQMPSPLAPLYTSTLNSKRGRFLRTSVLIACTVVVGGQNQTSSRR
jgi:hypothetical protein